MRPRSITLVAVASLATALAATMVARVPEGFFGVVGEKVLPPGWHLRAPLGQVVRVPAGAELEVPGLRLKTREGSDLGFRLTVAYRLGSRLSPQFARDLRASGLEGAIRSLADHVLQDVGARVDAETLLSNAALLETPLTAALAASGVEVGRLTFQSDLGSELIRRRATEQARSLSRPPRGDVLLIGWDGADWDTIRPLLAAGRMPHLARLLARGAHGDLRSYDPMFSPLIWTTIATGKAPTEHGIADFVVKEVSSGSRRPITSDFRKVKALWNVLTDFDRPSTWIAWWASYPAEPTDGAVVSDVVVASLLSGGTAKTASIPGIASPDGFLEQRKDLLVPASAIARADVGRFFDVSEADWNVALRELSEPRRDAPRKKGQEAEQSAAAFVCRVLSGTRTYHALAKDALRARVPFVAVYYEGIDMMGHRFQHFMPPKMQMVTPADFARFQHAVSRFYEYQDELLGDLLAQTSPGTTVVIVSDHGFLAGDLRPEGILPFTSVQPAEWHRDWGILVIAGPGIRSKTIPPASVYDIAPTLLYLEGLPLAEDMPGRLVEAAFEPSVLQSSQPRRVRSYELVGAAPVQTAKPTIDAAAMEEMMANLRALGYVGGDPGGAATSPTTEAEGDDAPRMDTQFYYHRNLAVSYIKQGRFREAEAELLAANARKPVGKTYSMLSEVRASQGRYADAAQALEEGWDKSTESMDPSSLLWIVELHLLANDRPEAEHAASRWSGKMTPAIDAAVRGRLAEAAGDVSLATAQYRIALQSDPLIVRVAQRLHGIEMRQTGSTSLEPFLLATLEAHPRVDAYWDLAGQIALTRGDVALAARRFQRARDIQPENGLYLGHFASASAAAGSEEDARAALAWAERFPPREADAWMALGSAWDRLGETERALRAFAGAKTAGLAGPGADVASALTLARAGRRDEAHRVLDAVAQRYPDNPAVRELRARLQ